MGNNASNGSSTTTFDPAAQLREAQLQELQDIATNYLDHLEFLIETRELHENKRDVLMILKSNLKTAREEINKIATQQQPDPTEQQAIDDDDDKNDEIHDVASMAFSNSNSTSSMPTTTQKSMLSSSSAYSNIRFAYDWCNANIEHLHFTNDWSKLGKINGVEIATSTFNPVIMATVSQDGKCRIWKLKTRSKSFDIVESTKKAHQVQMFEKDLLSQRIDTSMFTMNDQPELNNNNNQRKTKKQIKKEKKMKKKEEKKQKKLDKKNKKQNQKKGSLDSNPGQLHSRHTSGDVLQSSFGSNFSAPNSPRSSSNFQISRKDLRFEICNEISLQGSFVMCVAIHHNGNLIACGGLDSVVYIYDVTALNNSSAKKAEKKRKNKQSNTSDSGQNTPVNNGRRSISIGNKSINVNGGDDNEDIDVEGKDYLFSELTFWEEYISCILFLNDDQHIIVGSGDGSCTICNYVTQSKVYAWKCDSDVVAVDYVYTDPQDMKKINSTFNRGKSIANRGGGGSPLPSSPRNVTKKKRSGLFGGIGNKKKKQKEKEKEQEKEKENDDAFGGFPMVSGGDYEDSSSASMELNHSSHKLLNDSYNKRQIMVLIGTSSTETENVVLDVYNLSYDESDKMDVSKAKNKYEKEFRIKNVLNESVKFKISLNNKKCKTVKFSPNGKYFAIGGEACLYRIYNRANTELMHERMTKDDGDPMIIQRRGPNLNKKLNAINDEDNDDDNGIVTCLTWINEYAIAVGNSEGNYIYTSHILVHEYKIRNYLLKEWIVNIDIANICNEQSSTMSVDNIILTVNEFIGVDVADNVIETNFGDRISCLTAHPYFEMKKNEETQSFNDYLNAYSVVNHENEHRFTKKEGLFVAGSWTCTFQGCVLKG